MDEPHQEDPWSQPQQPERGSGELGDEVGLGELEEVPLGGLKVHFVVLFHERNSITPGNSAGG